MATPLGMWLPGPPDTPDGFEDGFVSTTSVAVGGRVVAVSRHHVVILSLSDGGSERAAALLLFALRRAGLGYEFGDVARLVHSLLPDFGALRA